MFASLGTQFGLIYGGFAVGFALALAAIAVWDRWTANPPLPGAPARSPDE